LQEKSTYKRPVTQGVYLDPMTPGPTFGWWGKLNVKSKCFVAVEMGMNVIRSLDEIFNKE
jgi:hypothetical protein